MTDGNNFAETISEVASHFAFEGRLIHAEPYGCGHINDTHCLWFDRGSHPPVRYILQRINTGIFCDVDGLMNNISLVTDHLRKKLASDGGDIERGTLSVIPTLDGKRYYRASDGGCYRAYRFVENTVSLQSVENPAQFGSLAAAFGHFQDQLADFDASLLVETIPNFHNTVKRFETFAESVRADRSSRRATVEREIEFASARESDAGVLVGMLAKGELPLRVTHNDTKLNNVLFDAVTGEAVCVIDLDTVMPGLVHYDFGDSIRFGASTAAEDERDIGKVSMSLELFEAYTRGFIASCGGKMTDAEMEYLPFSAKLLTYECGIRFLSDYLDGDTYFKIHYPDQNLDRCRTQFKLVADMEEKMPVMKDITARIAREYNA